MIKSKAWWSIEKFGKLRLKTPVNISTTSSASHIFVCECGKSAQIKISDVTSGLAKSCGRCDVMSSDWWSGRQFGKLSLKSPKVLSKNSKRIVNWVCVCGNIKPFSIRDVVLGKMKSCGLCARTRNRRAKLRTGLPKITKEIVQAISKAGYSVNTDFYLNGHFFDLVVKECKTVVTLISNSTESQQIEKVLGKRRKETLSAYGYLDISVNKSVTNPKYKEKTLNSIISTLKSRRGIGSKSPCKNEILAAIQELDTLLERQDIPTDLVHHIHARQRSLMDQIQNADEDIMSAAISSHHVMCSVKNMAPEEAFGNDPFVYYGLGLVGEAGELSGSLLRAIRNGGSREDKKTAVESELADCIIYSVILAYATGINLTKIVNDKARVVEARARAGYYGPPLR